MSNAKDEHYHNKGQEDASKGYGNYNTLGLSAEEKEAYDKGWYHGKG